MMRMMQMKQMSGVGGEAKSYITLILKRDGPKGVTAVFRFNFVDVGQQNNKKM
jgi:hypothetical protein